MATRVFWRNFRTKAEATTFFQGVIDPVRLYVPFEHDLIADLINEKHYFCSKHNYRPTRFRKVHGSNKYGFEGDFPSIGWKAVSWRKCIDRPLDTWDYVVRAMRDHTRPEKQAYRDDHKTCERCREAESEEVHHENPTFLEISKTVRAQVSEDDVIDCLRDWNWLAKENFQLPAGHKITLLFEALHATATLQAVCKPCHNETKKRKTKPTDC